MNVTWKRLAPMLVKASIMRWAWAAGMLTVSVVGFIALHSLVAAVQGLGVGVLSEKVLQCSPLDLHILPLVLAARLLLR